MVLDFNSIFSLIRKKYKRILGSIKDITVTYRLNILLVTIKSGGRIYNYYIYAHEIPDCLHSDEPDHLLDIHDDYDDRRLRWQ